MGGARFFLNVLGFCGLLVLFPFLYFCLQLYVLLLAMLGREKKLDVIALKIS